MEQELTDLITSQLDRLYRFAYNRLNDEFAAEDMTQDIVEAAVRSYPHIEDKERMMPWLWGIARNVYLRTINAKSKCETPSDDVIMIIDGNAVSYETPEKLVIQREDSEKIRRAVSYLAKAYRDVCVMYWLEDKDYNTIARELDIPLSSVKWRLNQSKVRLKEEIIKMEFMENGYRKAEKMFFNMGGYAERSGKLGIYDEADRVLEGLLAQNVCISAYDKPKTVTEIAADLGCAADYVEDVLTSLVKTQCVKQTKDRYQTSFPIWGEDVCREVFVDGVKICREYADEILDHLYALKNEMKAVGFLGSDAPIEQLVLIAIYILYREMPNDFFDTENLPFKSKDCDKGWYILGMLSHPHTFYNVYGFGMNSSGALHGDVLEIHIASQYTKDMRTYREEMGKQFYDFYTTGTLAEDYLTAKLIENGKIRKKGDGYEIAVPVISYERGDYKKLVDVLTPVKERVNELQQKMCARSVSLMKKNIPNHIAYQRKFFESYCAHGAWEGAVFARLVERGAEITQDMGTFFIVK